MHLCLCVCALSAARVPTMHFYDGENEDKGEGNSEEKKQQINEGALSWYNCHQRHLQLRYLTLTMGMMAACGGSAGV